MSVRNGIVLLVAVSILTFLVGCGGSSSPKPVPSSGGTFGLSNFSGTYVVSFSGIDANSSTASFFAIVGTIAADGKGSITGGTVDISDPNIGGFFSAQAVSASIYTVSSDGRGTATLVTPAGTFGLHFVLTSNGHGLITRFDKFGSGSGTLDLQSSASQSSLLSMAFSLSGVDSTANELSLGTVGAFTLDSSGNVTSGTQDFNDDGTSAGLTNLPITGSVVLTSSTSGTAQLTTSFGALVFDVWVIDSSHLKLIETDATGNILSGDAFTQQTSFTAGQLVFTLGGLDSAKNLFVAGGYVTTDANGSLTNGVEDFNDNGVASTQPSFTGSCTTFVAGRCQLALTGFSNGIAQSFTFAAYPSTGGVLLLEDDSLGLALGAAYTQTATSFAASQGYGLNLSGFNTNEVDDIAQFNAASATSTPNVTGLLDENDLGTPFVPVSLSGTYTPDSPATGRGALTVPSINTLNGVLGLEYYVVDASTALFIEGDSGQISLGTFQLQSTTSSPSAAQSGISMVRSILRPHAALRRK